MGEGKGGGGGGGGTIFLGGRGGVVCVGFRYLFVSKQGFGKEGFTEWELGLGGWVGAG